MASSAFAKPQAPWVNTLVSITPAETASNKWHLLYALAYITDSGYEGENLLLVLNHVCSKAPKCIQLINKMSADSAFNHRGLDFSGGSLESTVPQGQSPSSSSAEIAKFALINKTYISMVKLYFPCSTKVSDAVVTFLTGLIPVVHTSPECTTLLQLHDKLCKVLDTLSWVYRDLQRLGASSSDNCLKKDALHCLNKFFEHCSTPLAPTLRLTLKLQTPVEQAEDNLARWRQLRKAISECKCGETPISKAPTTSTPSPVLHSNAFPDSNTVPSDSPTPNDITEYLARLETSNAAFLSSIKSALSDGTRGPSDRSAEPRSRSRSPRRSLSWRDSDRDRDRDSNRDRDRDRDRDYDRDRYSRSRERRSQNSSNYHSGSSRSHTPACRDYARGRCKRGRQCRFEHSSAPASSSEPRICRYYESNTKCPYGTGCRFSHGPSGTTSKGTPVKNKQLDKLTATLKSVLDSNKEQKDQLAALSAYAATQKAAAEEKARTEAAEKKAFSFFQSMFNRQGYPSQQPQGLPSQQPLAIEDSTRSPLSHNPFPLLGWNQQPKN